jgi:hypothetical protein
VAAASPVGVIVGTGLAAILLAVALNPLLLIDFARAVAFTLAFHDVAPF